MIYVLFNPLADNSHGEGVARKWAATRFQTPVKFVSVIGLNFKDFLKDKKDSDEVILAGGDGTINRFANDVYGEKIRCKLSYAKSGSGNDFYNDVGNKEVEGRVDLKPYLSHLPVITVNGLKRRFVNGIGYGIDGDTCLVGEQIRKKDPTVKINYAKIAVKLLLLKFHPKKCEIEVDGKKHNFKNVWVAATMNGRYYGGKMMAAPSQNRLNEKHECDLVVLSVSGRIPALLHFPTFQKGKHDGKKYIHHFKGKHIKVTFDSPCALQIDGEVIPNVTSYTVDCED